MQDKEKHRVASLIQQECHDFIDTMIAYKKANKKKWAREDLMAVFIFNKLADIELRLRELEQRTTVSYN